LAFGPQLARQTIHRDSVPFDLTQVAAVPWALVWLRWIAAVIEHGRRPGDGTDLRPAVCYHKRIGGHLALLGVPPEVNPLCEHRSHHLVQPLMLFTRRQLLPRLQQLWTGLRGYIEALFARPTWYPEQ